MRIDLRWLEAILFFLFESFIEMEVFLSFWDMDLLPIASSTYLIAYQINLSTPDNFVIGLCSLKYVYLKYVFRFAYIFYETSNPLICALFSVSLFIYSVLLVKLSNIVLSYD